MQNQPLGMQIDQVIVLPTRGNPLITRRFGAFEQAMKNSPDIRSTTISELVPGEQIFGFVCKFEDQEEAANYASNPVGHDFFETYQMELAAGRTFQRDLPTDTIEKAIINESLARLLGWKDPNDALHKRFDFGNDGEVTGEVIGVIKDAHFNSLRHRIQPMVYFIEEMFYQRISIRVNTNNMQASLDHVEETWKQFFPDLPFEYFFADAFFGKQYLTDQRLAYAFTCFVAIAILLATIGLISLSALMLRRRVKEIAIRKIVGATTPGLTRMLTGEFVGLAIIAMLIAFPVSWYAMQQWLKTYAFRIDIPLCVFIVNGCITLIGVVVSVSAQSVKAALANPVKSLRSE
jgi:putative ABC transport system permease protein